MEGQDIETLEDAQKLLRRHREENVRKSSLVVDLWKRLLSKNNLSPLGDEKWMILEQVAVAAMDVHDGDVVDKCLKKIKAEFESDSFRVRRLDGMRFEMDGRFDVALEIYERILDEDETNSAARKRKVAIHKQMGDNMKAICELNRYLKDFMSDAEAWMELCDLYIEEQDYTKAAFCCEELLLHNPNNHIYFQRYAEIRYTQGGVDNIKIAKTYYSKAVTQNPENMRALYGLLLTSSQLASSPKSSSQEKRENLKTVTWTTNQITQRYEEKRKEPLPLGLLEGLMGQLQVTPPQTAN